MLNELVRALANLRDASATELSAEAGVNPSTVSRYLNGTTDLKTESFVKILRALGVQVDRILQRELLNRLINKSVDCEIEDDLVLVFNTLSELDQKSILHMILSSPSHAPSLEVKSARRNLFLKVQNLALRKRRLASC